jgi:bifunctional non-homologous end joining protein LigD
VADGTPVEVGDRRLSLSNLDKVLYPDSGTTKAEVIDYYARIAPVMVDHTGGRCMTMRRYPNGVDGKSFFEKRCPSHRPDWLPTSVGPGDRKGELRYCRFDEPAALVWAANLAALELHAPMARADDLDHPLMCVFDLDPGPGTAIPECAQLALEIHEVLASADLEAVVKTSGSKGMQVYVPLNATGKGAPTHEDCASFALAVGQLLEKRQPSAVTTTMAKVERPGKVFVDWSQNAHHKTTVCVYSMRARPRPTVSTPVTWDEVAAAADGRDPLVFEITDVLDRVETLGDVFAPALDLVQHLPRARS